MPDATTRPDDDKSPGQIAPLYTWRTALVKSLDCSTCKLVALVLSLHMNEIGGSAFPSNRLLAEETSLGISTVREHLNGHLHAHGWLTLIERGGTSTGVPRANSWQAVIPIDPRQLSAGPRQQDDHPRQQTAPPPPADRDPVVHGSIHEQTAGVVVKCTECGQSFPSMDAMCDHQETECLALHEQGGAFQDAREALRKAGGHGSEVPA
jgi:helix-turn-helix protein